MKSFVFSVLTIGLLHYYIITLNKRGEIFQQMCLVTMRNARLEKSRYLLPQNVIM